MADAGCSLNSLDLNHDNPSTVCDFHKVNVCIESNCIIYDGELLNGTKVMIALQDFVEIASPRSTRHGGLLEEAQRGLMHLLLTLLSYGTLVS